MDVTKLTAEQTRSILDFVLENSYHPKDYWNIKEDLLKHEEYFPDHDEYLLKMSLNKLKQDGYVDFISINGTQQKFIEDYSAGENMTIRRNFKGHTFLANGGYEGEQRRLLAELKDKNDYQVRAEALATDLRDWTRILAVRTNDLKNWTKAVAIGAIGLVVWEVVAYLLEHYS